MITTSIDSNAITGSTDVEQRCGLKREYHLDWLPDEAERENRLRIITTRGDLARRLLGAGQCFAPERDAVAELVAERAIEDHAPIT